METFPEWQYKFTSTGSISLFWIGALLILSVSCSTNKTDDHTVTAEPITDTLRARIVPVGNDSLLLPVPYDILNVNDEYIVLHYLRSNDFIRVYKLPSMQYLYSWGRQGRGPHEFIQPPDYINSADRNLILHDHTQREFRIYKINDSGFEHIKRQTFSYKQQRSALNDIQRINDSLYFATYERGLNNPPHEFIGLSPDNDQPLFRFGEYPETELTGFKRFVEFSKTGMVSPDGSKFASFYGNYNTFKLFDTKGNLLKEIQVDDSLVPNEVNEDEDFIYRTAEYATDDYIFALGRYQSSPKSNKDSVAIYRSLEVWNWNGEPVYRAKLDQPILRFTISKREGDYKLYGPVADQPTVLYEYTLPEVFAED